MWNKSVVLYLKSLVRLSLQEAPSGWSQLLSVSYTVASHSLRPRYLNLLGPLTEVLTDGQA